MKHIKKFKSFESLDSDYYDYNPDDYCCAIVDDDELEVLKTSYPEFIKYMKEGRITTNLRFVEDGYKNGIFIKDGDVEVSDFLGGIIEISKPGDNISEGIFNKFITGHENREEFEKSKQCFEDELDRAESKLKSSPEDYAQSKNWDKIKTQLIKSAKDNKYRGKLRTQRGGRDNRYFIVYDDGHSGFQKMASNASAGISGR